MPTPTSPRTCATNSGKWSASISRKKRRAGQLDFMDLLLYARDLLRHDGARAELQTLYHRIFVDEFQDTDPLQAEILLLLAAADPGRARLAQGARPRPASCSWWATRSNRSTASGAPTRACSAASATTCKDGGAGDARAHQQHALHARRSRASSTPRSRRSIPDYLPLEGGVDGPAGPARRSSRCRCRTPTARAISPT